MHIPLFYRQKPIFGLDIGQSSIKLVQLRADKPAPRVVGYGYATYDRSAVKNGEIINPEAIAEALKPLIKQRLIGKVTSNRALASFPTDRSFIRIIRLPEVNKSDLEAAVKLEAEQYIPLPQDQLYLEHMVLERKTSSKEVDVLLVATPKTIVTSYIKLFELLNWETEGLEPGLFSIMRAVNYNRPADTPRIIIDFGSNTSDLAIYDSTIRLTSTLASGGDDITAVISKALKIAPEQAEMIKTRFGITKSQWQTELATALQPILSDLANEVQKMMRYFRDHNENKALGIAEIIIVGGGANLPGLADFLSHLTGVPVTICNPWERIAVKPLQPPHQLETTIYTTAVGLALKEVL